MRADHCGEAYDIHCLRIGHLGDPDAGCVDIVVAQLDSAAFGWLVVLLALLLVAVWIFALLPCGFLCMIIATADQCEDYGDKRW